MLPNDNPITYNCSEAEQLTSNLQNCKDSKSIIQILQHLGRLPNDFDASSFLPLLSHANSEVRYWVVKTLGKASNYKYIPYLFGVALNDSASLVRREAVSSIGRMRTAACQPMLLHFLKDNDPNIVLQAIRGLLVFREDKSIRESLCLLANHPNEMIQSVIKREFFSNVSMNTFYSHIDSPDILKNTIVHGDVRDILHHIPEESIHLTFTSPPYYNARDYSIYVSYNDYLDLLTEVFLHIHRITKEGRFLIVNTSPVIVPRISRAHASKRYPIPFDLHNRLVQNGWDFIDDIVWMKPESSVKNRNAGFLQHRKPLAYKPNAITEYLMVYRKHTEKLLDWNMRQYPDSIIEKSRVFGDYETSNVWEIDPTYDRVHSAVFPVQLCNRVIIYYSYQGDLIFDPFGGSGTLGRAALGLNRYFFMTEKEGIYIDRMRKEFCNTHLFDKPTRFFTTEQFAQLWKEDTSGKG